MQNFTFIPLKRLLIYRVLLMFVCLLSGLSDSFAQAPANCSIILDDNVVNPQGGYQPYKFYHKDGTTNNLFYVGETIYSYAVNTANSCRSPNSAVFRTPNMPTTSFTPTCTGVNYPFFNGTPATNCLQEQLISPRRCQSLGGTQFVYSRAQRFEATTTGDFTITFNNGDGTTVNLNILERYAIYTDCGNLAGNYNETGTQNGKKKFVDADGNELYYDDTNARWVISGSMGIAYSVVSTTDAPPLTGWQVEDSGCIGHNIRMVYGETYSKAPLIYDVSVLINTNYRTHLNGVYYVTSISKGRPVLTNANGKKIESSSVDAFSGWSVDGGSFNGANSISLSLTVPTSCWEARSSGGSYWYSANEIVVTQSTTQLANPIIVSVQTNCGNYDGTYTQTKSFNERPDLLDEDQNRLFYWGIGDPNHPEGWYIADANNKFVYYNNSNSNNPPTTDWQAFTGDGVNCTGTIEILNTAKIAYWNTSFCKSVTQAAARVIGEGITGGTFSSTQGLSIDANTGTINPSTSTAGTYTISYSKNGDILATTSITIEDLKSPSVTITANPSGSITAGTSVTFTTTPIHGGTTPTYVWKKNDTVIPNETGATYTTNTLVNGDKIKVEMSSNDACASPTMATSNEITVAVKICTYTPSNITITYIGGGILGFSGPPQSPAIYTPNGTLNNAPKWSNQFGYVIRWSGSPNNRWEIFNEADINFVIAYNASGNINNIPCASTNWVVDEEYGGGITLGGGCGNLAPQAVTPSVTIAANPSGSITAGTSVTFTAAPTNGGTTPTYVWKKNDTVIPNETSTNYTTTTLANGDKIKVEMTSNDACALPTMATSNEITVIVTAACNVAPPTINLPNEKLVCFPNNLTLTASGCTGTVTWSNGSSGTSLTLSNVGTYSLSATCTVNGCASEASTSVTGLEIKDKPNAPTVNAPTEKVVCSPSTLTLTATGCNGTVTWSNGSSGTTLTLTNIGTYSVSATCTVNGCTSEASTSVTGLEIKAKPNAPTVNAPTEKVVCSPSTLTLTASGCAGTVTWSNAATGTTLTLTNIGTYSVSATCTVNGCTSEASTSVTGLEIKAKPNAPTVNTLTEKVVCFPSTLTLTASGCAGTVTWSNAATGTTLILSNVGTYSLSANCTVNGCTSEASASVTGLEIKAKPNAPTVNAPTEKVVCSPSTLTLTASGCAGTVTWSNAATGTTLILSNVGTYSLSANCTVNGCTSEASTAITGLEIKAKPNAPTVNAPTQKVVCSPSTLTLTASGCTGTVTWSNGASGTSVTLSNVGTYSVSATCSVNGCTSDASATVTGLEIKAKPNAPTVNAPTEKVVCSPSTLTLTASGCAGTVTWSNGASSTSVTLSNVGTYSLSANCTVNGCNSDASTAITGLEIKAKPNAPTVNAPTQKVVCSPNTLTLTANCTLGTVVWSTGATGTSLTLSNVGTYSISATCTTIPASTPNTPTAVTPTITGCTSDASAAITGLEIKAKPSPPTINAPTEKVVCSPNTLTLTANCTLGTVVWSTGATGTSLTLSNVGTYSISATCTTIPASTPTEPNAVTPTITGCTSDASAAITGLEIKAKPSAPTVNAPTEKVVCSPSTLTLTASGCNGTITWSNGASGTSVTLSNVGTYSLSANCTANGCNSDASTAITGLEIKAKPNAPTVNAPTQKVVCSPNTLTLTASGCAGTVTWSNATTGTSLTLSNVGTYSLSATCSVNGCTSDASASVSGLEIKAKPNAPTVNTPTEKVICSPSMLTMTASGCAGTVTWSNGASGTSVTLSNVGTYSLSANCTVNGCTSDASEVVNGLEIKAKPSAPTINAPFEKIVCFPNSLILTASGCEGTITWSQGNATGTSITLTSVGTYSISATCTVRGCTSEISEVINGIEIKALPNAQASNTGPYLVEQNIDLMASGGVSYNWIGPNNFSSTSQNPSINNAILAMSGTYTVTVTGGNACISTATTSVAITGVDPCDPSRIVDYIYLKAANPYQALFPLSNGMVINQRNELVSILAKIVCPVANIKSFEMNIQGPELNWNIIQNVAPYTLFDNFKLDVFGRNFIPGNYTLTVTGFPEVNKSGQMTYGPKIIQFTVVGDLAVINAPVISKNSICAGSSIDVNIATNGTFIGGDNIFQVQLSDSSGSFAAPIVIGTTNTTGNITCTIPLNTVQGNKYLIRVASSNQVVASNPTMSFVTVHPFRHNVYQAISDNQTKKAIGSINANNKIIAPAQVNFEAGKTIELNPGFAVEAGSVFKADIKTCDY